MNIKENFIACNTHARDDETVSIAYVAYVSYLHVWIQLVHMGEYMQIYSICKLDCIHRVVFTKAYGFINKILFTDLYSI